MVVRPRERPFGQMRLREPAHRVGEQPLLVREVEVHAFILARRRSRGRFDDGGPVFLAVKIDDKPGVGKTPRDPALIRNRFMKGLGTGRGGDLDA